ncbi:MAG: endo-1,4-beta-xylanase [Gemmatimonadaceae bacterium]
MNPRRNRMYALLALTAGAACAKARTPMATGAAVSATSVPSLKQAFASTFMIGAALNAEQFFERDISGASLAATHFNTITPENVLKWESVHPRPGEYDFAVPDRYVAFGEQHGMFVVGHTLVWHQQTPRWVFEDASGKPVSRDTLLARLRDHIHTVVGRYKGRIRGWDVVNEALNEDGTLRPSPWLTIIGDDYLVKAFELAREADPNAELYYNDYSIESAPKRNGAVALIRRLQSQGVKVTGMGLQGHNKLDWPTVAQQDSTIAAFAALGVKVMITELDVDVLPPVGNNRGADISFNAQLQDRLNPYRTALPDSVQQRLAARYAELFGVYLKHRQHISRVTFWGVADGDSWLNNWPVRGRTSYPLLFDRSGAPKPAFDAIVRLLRQRVVSE